MVLLWMTILWKLDYKKIKPRLIINIPETIPIITWWFSPYSLANGKSVSNEIYTIIPATAAVIIPIAWSGMIVFKNNTPINPPIGSEIPDRN